MYTASYYKVSEHSLVMGRIFYVTCTKSSTAHTEDKQVCWVAREVKITFTITNTHQFLTARLANSLGWEIRTMSSS